VTYGKLISIKRNGGVYEAEIEVKLEPKPGQFITLVFPKFEVPLSIGDYVDGVLYVHFSSEKIYQLLSKRMEVMVKGPLGRPIALGKKVLGIAEGGLYYDILFPLREAKRKGSEVAVNCKGCRSEFREPLKGETWDTVIASVRDYKALPSKSLVYVRWVKMNCMMGVCGVCEVKGNLPCVEGPFLEVERLVDKG
jgi:NAD(P)H-flavin reductase